MKFARSVAALIGVFSWNTACGGFAASAPTAPSAGTATLAVFLDRETGFTTSDVHDAQDQVVRFTDAGELLWAADGTRLTGFLADGEVVTADRVCAGCYFLVRFGTRNGERRAYLTWAGVEHGEQGPTLLDLEITGDTLAVNATDLTIPHN